MRLTRRGATLLELLVATSLFLCLVSLAARALGSAERQQRSLRAGAIADHAIDQLAGMTAQALDQRDPSVPVLVLGDTGVAFGLPVGHGVACAAGGDSLLLPRAGAGMWWAAEPDSGDVVTAHAADGRVTADVVRAVQPRSATGRCPAGAWRLTIGAAPSAASFVRLARPLRHAFYRGGDGLWWWGERHCRGREAAACGPAQPLAGPFTGPVARLQRDSLHGLLLLSPREGDAERRVAVALGPTR